MTQQLPTREDPVARAASEVIGGPVGRYARVGQRGWLAAAAVLSALGSMVVALGVLQKNSCVRTGWATPNSLWRMCYSDLPAAANGAAPGSAYDPFAPGTNQPFLTAMLTWVMQLVTPDGSSPLARQQWFFALAAVVVALLVAGTVCAVAWMLPDTPWRAAHVALSPVLITSALVSLDLFGVLLMAAGLAAWVRRHPVAAGALLGAAVMARSFPLIVLAAVALVGWRAGRRDDVRKTLAAAAGVIVLCLVLAYALGGDPLAPYRLWADQAAAYGSVWKILEIVGVTLPAGVLTAIAVLGWVVALAVGGMLVARERPLPLIPVATVMLVIVMVTGKSNPVQAATWLLPLIAASLIGWRDHLLWAGVEITAFVATWLYVGSGFDSAKGLPAAAYALVSLARLLALGALAWRMVDLAQRADERARAAEPQAQPGRLTAVPSPTD